MDQYTEQPPYDLAREKLDETGFGDPGGATYADPRSIEHETAGPAGEEYALVTTKKKGKAMNQVSKLGLLTSRKVDYKSTYILSTGGTHKSAKL